MPAYLARRIGQSLLAIWAIVTIVFVATRVLGDPALMLLPLGTPAEHVANLRQDLGLDRPLAVQYVAFLARAAVGDLGLSYQYSRPAMALVLERMPATLALAGGGLLVGALLGLSAGFLAAITRGNVLGALLMSLILVGQATPTFWLGIALILLFAVELGWLPTGGFAGFVSLVLPAFSVGLFVAANIARLFRTSILEQLSQEYVRTARAKGIHPAAVYVRHAARNALIPTVTMLSLIAADLLGGSPVTETIFSWPGVGRLLVEALSNSDFPVVQAGVLLIATIFVGVNLLVDLFYTVLDPRIRLAR